MEIKKDEDKVVNKVEDKKDTTVVRKEEKSTPSLDNVEDSEGIGVNEIKDSKSHHSKKNSPGEERQYFAFLKIHRRFHTIAASFAAGKLLQIIAKILLAFR